MKCEYLHPSFKAQAYLHNLTEFIPWTNFCYKSASFRLPHVATTLGSLAPHPLHMEAILSLQDLALSSFGFPRNQPEGDFCADALLEGVDSRSATVGVREGRGCGREMSARWWRVTMLATPCWPQLPQNTQWGCFISYCVHHRCVQRHTGGRKEKDLPPRPFFPSFSHRVLVPVFY